MIVLPTKKPDLLLAAIKEAIDSRRVRTWTYDKDGDFTLKGGQWDEAAWLTPILGDEELKLYIIPPAKSVISRRAYAAYHGRFIEIIFGHFDSHLSDHASASPFAEGDDQIE